MAIKQPADNWNKSRGKPKARVIILGLLPDGPLTEADLDAASGQGMAVTGSGHVYRLAEEDENAEPKPGQVVRTHESIHHAPTWAELQAGQ